MQDVTARLVDGSTVRITPYMLEVTNPAGEITHTLDTTMIRRVERAGARVTVVLRKAEPVVLEGASIDDAGRIETALRATPALAPAPAQAQKSGGGFGKMMKWGCLGTLGVVALFVVLGIAMAGGDDDGSSTSKSSGNTSAASTAKVGNDDEDVHAPLSAGSSGTVEPIDDRAVKVTINDIVDPATSDNQFSKPGDGNRWYAIDVTVEAVGAKAVTPGSWKMRTADGFEYERTFAAGVGESLDFSEIAAGGKKKGMVVFEIPHDAIPAWIRFDPNVVVDGDLYFDAS